ncbi:MAG: DNA replication and repair protein RecF [Nitrospinae bacterium]|nr:DNA replication and repair protein RecF [Nitrospinota bacterium]
MRLSELTLKNFRNYRSLRFRPHSGFNYIYGDNGSGKTNLLEAIYYLSHLRSFRRISREKMVLHGSKGMYASGVFTAEENAKVTQLEAAFHGRDRKYKKDGQELRGLVPYLDSSHVIVFFPETPQVIKEGPAARRRFFDQAIAAVEPQHLEDSRGYLKLLSERNHLLRNGGDSAMIQVWQERLIEKAARIIVRRKRYIHSLKNRLSHLENLFGETRESRVSVSYEAGGLPGKDEDAEEDIRDALQASAQRLAREEMARKTTLWGPQLDDFHLSWNGRRAKDVASQGEQRLITILLVAANAGEYKRRRRETPVVLLDDLGSELDAGRNKRVLLFLGSLGAQTFITSTEEPRIRENEIDGRTFLVRDAMVESKE